MDANKIKLADFLLDIKAIKFNTQTPYTWASGWKSPIYCDNRTTLSFPEIRTFIKEQISALIQKNFPKVELIAGVATGGIPQGALVADALGLPFVYVRSSGKQHGLGNQVEGIVEKGQNTVVIEDLISTGGSSLKAVEALKATGANINGLVAIFTYGFDLADKSFKDAKCPYYTLLDYPCLITRALETGYVQNNEVDALKIWRENPGEWKGM